MVKVLMAAEVRRANEQMGTVLFRASARVWNSPDTSRRFADMDKVPEHFFWRPSNHAKYAAARNPYSWFNGVYTATHRFFEALDRQIKTAGDYPEWEIGPKYVRVYQAIKPFADAERMTREQFAATVVSLQRLVYPLTSDAHCAALDRGGNDAYDRLWAAITKGCIEPCRRGNTYVFGNDTVVNGRIGDDFISFVRR